MKLIQRKAEILKAFKCQKTGRCCRREGKVIASPYETQKMAMTLKIDITTFLLKYTKRRNGWTFISDDQFRKNCFLNDCNQCQIYKSRPKACRTYPNWNYIWKTDEALLNEASVCKGLQTAIQIIQTKYQE